MSLRNAINLKCKDCIYDPADLGRWREQVAKCLCVDCALYSFRPKPRAKNTKTLSFKSIRGVSYTKPLGKVIVLWKRSNRVSYLDKTPKFKMGVKLG